MNTDAEKIFYEAVLSIGAYLALVDGKADSAELAEIKRYFSIDIKKLPEASAIYNGFLHKPISIDLILSPFKNSFRNSPEVSESLLFGMCLVAKADGKIHNSEIEALNRISDLIGLDQKSKERVFESAGIYSRTDRDGQKPTERSDLRKEHLSVLGLLSNASQDEITTEYRRLVKRYHPDALRSQGLPVKEIRHAESILARINQAYEWLKKNQN